MSLPGITPRTQSEIVDQALAETQKFITDVIKTPGITTLHNRPIEEIGAVLANLIKSKAGITSLKFVVGSHIEITYDNNPLNQVR